METSLVATTSTLMPLLLKMSKTVAMKPTWPSMRVLTMSSRVIPGFSTMLVIRASCMSRSSDMRVPRLEQSKAGQGQPGQGKTGQGRIEQAGKVPACAFSPGKEASDNGYLWGGPIGSGEGGTNVGKGLLIAHRYSEGIFVHGLRRKTGVQFYHAFQPGQAKYRLEALFGIICDLTSFLRKAANKRVDRRSPKETKLSLARMFLDIPVIQIDAVSVEPKIQRCKKKQIADAAQHAAYCSVTSRDVRAPCIVRSRVPGQQCVQDAKSAAVECRVQQ
ncbi:MAG: hypothetical protein FRX49_11578 [Trebouxia sp. A1-2]|nr:MAG: hypothetical protein FRX49_11578 [Trebouxia sp. A1-2]